MHSHLQAVFNLFPQTIGIIGSAIKNPEGAKDIDVLFLVKEEFEEACKFVCKKWNGWDAHNGHVRIANIDRGGKKIQLIHVSGVTEFAHHPHCVLLRDGSFVKEGVFMVKEPGWRYEKWPNGKGVLSEKGTHCAGTGPTVEKL